MPRFQIQDLLNEKQMQRLENSLNELAESVGYVEGYEENNFTPVSVKLAHERAVHKVEERFFTELESSPLSNAFRNYRNEFHKYMNLKSSIKITNLIPAIQRYNNHNINWAEVCSLLGLEVFGVSPNIKGLICAKVIVGWTNFNTNQLEISNDINFHWRIGPYQTKYIAICKPYPYAPPRTGQKRYY